MRTLSPAPTGFQYASVACTWTAKPTSAVCEAGLPVRPDTLPGKGSCPGTMICNRLNEPGCTVKGSLVPLMLGSDARYATMLTLPRLMLVSSARYMVTLPDHTPPDIVTVAGVMRPSPRLVTSR